MLYSKRFIYTLKENPKEATLKSHNLLLRGSFITKLSSGIYTYLPLGLSVLNKVSNIVREELNKQGAIEILMPSIQPAELWMESKRWHDYGKELLRIKDRSNRDFVYGPTHEEVVVDVVRRFVKSYKELPINLYHIQNKFRDEIRPRFGLMRAREFIMKDAYSFDADALSLDESYNKMKVAYINIFNRCGLKFKIVAADSGAIGGKDSEEFMVLSEAGEDALVSCDLCDYAANLERAQSLTEDVFGVKKPLKKIHTPNKKTIKDVCDFLGINNIFSLKSLLYKNEEKKIFCFLIEGDDELNETKAKRLTNSTELSKLDDFEMVSSNLIKGFVGPVGLNKNITIVCDNRVVNKENCVVGANEEDFHYINAKVHRDFEPDIVGDIRNVKENEICPECKKGHLSIIRGIEVGHIFKLNDKYSKSMNATFLDKDGKAKHYLMGCYGIGIGRTMQAIAEQSFDDDGIIWPISVAPFEVEIVSLDTREKAIKEFCDILYRQMLKDGIDVLYDDRDERAGIKLKDTDLIGIPIRVIVGRKNFSQGYIEISERKNKIPNIIGKDNIISFIKSMIKKMYENLEV